MGNAYDNASLIVTPNAYKASKIYALKPTDGSGDLSFSRAGSKMVRNSAGLWETIGTNIPPLHYPVGGGCPSWLFEAEATNEALYSNQIDDAYWGKLDIAITANTSVAPDGTTTAESAVLSGTSTTPRTINRNAGVSVANATITFSCFVKYVDKQFIQLVFSSAFSNEYANFDLQNGTVTSGTYAAATIENNGNGWYRISVTTTGLNTTCIPFVWAIDAGNAARAADSTSNGTQSYLLWNIQIEIGSTATSPIITAGSSATRLRDVPTGTMIAGTLGYTIVTNVNSLTNTAAIRNFLDLSNGSGRQGILAKSAANKLIFQVYLNGTLVNTLTSTNDLPSGMGKCAIVFNGTTYKIFMDGGLEGTLAAVGGFPNAYGFNDAASSIEQKDLEYYNVALSDSEIVDLITA